ncbi:CRISPR-associated endoribonuclease Cas6 [Mongoliitalea daihaiensis]|uniref:CRISPR-associated endoribonuclease Cas6 n=1 Tax=Mongoliitalea daihaiensis TaxID=2782006 RepID=UPI001F45A96C|nr:CRISPR-associated endoribonuclease Cas6 [Mongoliitalea daihaiensis]UJP63460.1 CRISPR-associated endoribonuclease Cas6 [Mongoliitalea daihaiensis]
MRFKINLSRISRGKFIPINYQYELSSVIYKIINNSDSDFAKFLHETGYSVKGNSFKLFTFSQIKFDKSKVYTSEQRIEHQGEFAYFFISFLVDKAAEEFVKGLFIYQKISIGDKISRVDFEVVGIEGCTPPVFQERMNYRCISPLLIKQKRADGGENYLEPEHALYKEILIQNLCNKALAFALTIEHKFLTESIPACELVVNGKIYKKGIRIKQHTQMASHLIGYMFEFELTAPLELHEIGFYAGFGHLGSQGFGCVEVKD